VSRHLIIIGVIVVGLAAWLVLRGGNDNASTSARPTPSPGATAAADTPRTSIVRTPYWEKQHAASDEQAAVAGRELPSLPAPSDPARQAALDDHRRGAGSLRSTTGAAVSEAELDQAVARVESTSGPMNKEERLALEKSLLDSRKRKEERVPGMNQARENLVARSCTGPEAQQRYAQLSDAEKLKMQKRCAPHGFKPL
jgi:hypothetical protein